jgi:hypothetical protein
MNGATRWRFEHFSILPLLQFLYFWTIERYCARPKPTGGVVRCSALTAEALHAYANYSIFYLFFIPFGLRFVSMNNIPSSSSGLTTFAVFRNLSYIYCKVDKGRAQSWHRVELLSLRSCTRKTIEYKARSTKRERGKKR